MSAFEPVPGRGIVLPQFTDADVDGLTRRATRFFACEQDADTSLASGRINN